MSLVPVDSYEITDFIRDTIPKYAILSDAWDQEEVSFQDMKSLETAQRKNGFVKIEHYCRHTKADGW